MGLFDGCLIASDVDGTLEANGYLNPENLKQIEFFVKEGGKFSLASGRSAGALIHVAKKLKGVAASVSANGSLIYDFQNKCIVSQHLLPKKDYDFARFLMEETDVGIEVHAGLNVLAVRQTKETKEHQIHEKLEVLEVSLEEAFKYDWNKVLFACKNKKQQQALARLAKEQNCKCDFVNSCAELNGRTDYYFEQLPKGVSKIAALRELSEIFKIEKGGLFAIGDYYNDLEMLKGADISAVPDDSPEDIKLYADYLTCSCNDGAVADFIKYLTRKRLKEI